MKRKIILSLSFSLLISMVSLGQSQYNPSNMYDYYLSYYHKFKVEQPIQQQTIVYTNKKGKTRTTKYEYNRDGKIIKVYKAHNGSEEFLRDTIAYDSKTNKLTSLSHLIKKGN